MRILIVDDEEVALNSVKRLLKWRGIRNVDICDNGRDAITKIKETDFDIVLLDLLMPEVDGLQVLESTRPYRPLTEFIILTAIDDIPTTVKAIRLGAYDYLVKPVDNDLLFLAIKRAYEHRGLLIGLSTTAGDNKSKVPNAFSEIVTQCPQMCSILSYAKVMAGGGNPIMITGESGTGKELVAKGIHQAGSMPHGPFIAVNVSAIPATMFESQFFGHAKGAFTGAETLHRGYFEQADGGTLFLDEISELPVGLQTKLLRVLEEKSFYPLGSSKPIWVDVRVISASNSNIEKACQEGNFRLDLLYRLKSVHIHLPPLRERSGDIPLLASHFLRKSCGNYNKKEVIGFSPEALDLLINRDYPGNVRELSQIIDNAVLLTDSNMILPFHLGMMSTNTSSSARKLCTFKENDEAHLIHVLTNTNGDRSKVAQILGITVRQLQRKIAAMKKNPQWEKILRDI
ncbi:putative sensory histidine kinase YfhA [Smithella sp. ME-1]|uniref:Response regulator n=1 Tax=hydrocarbon metagenome TaxID=938273 RepID=A0A0W8FMI6_9ZZZZ|nr:putative sensory histidine kinase YfhA [Smithella sp. ME-1]